MKYVKFMSMSVKARMHLLQDKLIELGYDVDVTCKRDKKTVKALMAFQKSNLIVPNGCIDENVYTILFRKGK